MTVPARRTSSARKCEAGRPRLVIVLNYGLALSSGHSWLGPGLLGQGALGALQRDQLGQMFADPNELALQLCFELGRIAGDRF